MTALQPYEPGPSTELTRYDTAQDAAIQRLGEWARSADAAFSVAARLVQSSFVPQQFRGKPVEAAAAILAGIEVGLSPMASLRAFDVIQGVAAPKAITQRAVAQAHGHQIILVESTATRCRIKARRRGDDEWQNITWTIDRARDLGLTTKDAWKKQPIAMLLARATSEAARLVAADAMLGIAYSAEEIADGGSFDQEVATDTTTPATPTGTQRIGRPRRPVQPVPDPAPDSDGLDEFHPDTTENLTGPAPSITRAQQSALMASYTEAGITERVDRLLFAAEVIGRQVETSNGLTKSEASAVIDKLKDGEFVERWRGRGDDGYDFDDQPGGGTLPIGGDPA